MLLSKIEGKGGKKKEKLLIASCIVTGSQKISFKSGEYKGKY